MNDIHEQRDVVIVEAVRTPVGRRNGILKDMHPAVLGARVLQELLKRVAIEPSEIEQVVFGCVTQVGEQAYDVGRTAWLTAGFPVETPATTVDLQCGSSQQAVHLVAGLIRSGVLDTAIAGGVEVMTRVPMGANVEHFGKPWPPELLEDYGLVAQGISAELMARKYDVSRAEMDAFGVRSHTLAASATDNGYLRSQMLPIDIDGVPITHDEGIRRQANYDAVAALPPAFDPSHRITAGNSSQISDGAAALLLMSRSRADELGLRPRARITAQSVVGVDPVLMLEGPIPATRQVLQRAHLDISDIDLFEINEAFASVVLAWQKATEADMDRTNVNGGAIAIGHPLGASGARIMTQLLYELERRDAAFGLQSMCCGGGMGIATVVDRLGIS
jgi:acetyl-CoA acyltransferase